MTREDQICEAGQEYLDSMDEFQRYHTYPRGAFIDGAKWADTNPQFSKEEFMEKACWWLRETAYFYVSDFTGELDDNGLLEDFKRAMEE